jgi:hypothetical protein
MMPCRRPDRASAATSRDEFDMGTIIDFPADAASRRLGSTMVGAPREGMAIILILPSVRIERDETNGGSGPEEGTAPGRRRRRR